MDLKDRLAAIRDHLLEGLVERDVAVRLGLLAAVSGEHLLLVGPPGTAKSLLARRLRGAFADASYFERLLTRFSVPEELFGPLSVAALEDDRYLRRTQGYLPEASVAFLDEIFKANSAILNALLTLLNERAFDNDGIRHPTPLITVVGASNELPEGEELEALYDRFLLRLYVGPVSEGAVDALLDLTGDETGEVPEDLRLTRAELDGVRVAARGVGLTGDLRDLLKDLRRWLAEQGIAFSDRRLRKVVELLRVVAHTDGRSTADVWDAWMIQHCAWEDPAQREAVAAWWGARVGTLRATSPSRLLEMVAAWEARLEEARTEQAQRTDAQGRALYLDEDGGLTPEPVASVARTDPSGRPLYLAPPLDSYEEVRVHRTRPDGSGYTESELGDLDLFDPERGGGQFFRAWPGRFAYLEDPANRLTETRAREAAMGPRIFPHSHVDGWVAQLDGLADTVRTYLDDVARRQDDLAVLRAHLWVPGAVARQAEATLAESREVATGLLDRIAALREGFAALPTRAS
jgi:MoxR-like ATPase